ncbi:GDP-mannose 4,6-dehydratase [Patescibacteria group bacterium]|nr:GDP-mannose 4,6-dehydratase [Patescibacteria group bacterium]
MKKRALITGVTGQDGAYLSQFLLKKGYKIFGGYRRISSPNFWRLEYLGIKEKIELVPFDLLDESSMVTALKKSKPDEIYNLASQSFVAFSFYEPLITAQITGLGAAKFLDAVRLFSPKSKFYQASTSEMFGGAKETPQSEKTPFYPKSPYGVSKLFAHWSVINYRESYNLFACAGILFNHESPLRGLEFVTRKITSIAVQIKLGLANELKLGNLEAKRDWGYAPDYVEAMWKMLQLKEPEDFVIATGESRSVREFAKKTFAYLGLDYRDYVKMDKKFFRPADVNILRGDSSKAKRKLGWNPRQTSFNDLVKIMVEADLKRYQNKGEGKIF